jgi:hypothetical protein
MTRVRVGWPEPVMDKFRYSEPSGSSRSNMSPALKTRGRHRLVAFTNPNFDSRFLVEQSEPVLRRFVLQAVHSKKR